MADTLIEAVKLAKFLHLGYRSHSDNRWDRALDALEGVDVKRADRTAQARVPAAASIPSSATAATPSGLVALDTTQQPPSAHSFRGARTGATGGQL